MRSLRQAREDYFNRLRKKSRWHRPLPQFLWMLSPGTMLGIDLDQVLEGPEVPPQLPVASREEQIVVATELTEAERVSIQLQHAAEMRDPNGVRRGRYAKHRSAEQARRLQELVDQFQRESRRR